jgi:serine/threonine-protein kinase
MVPGLILVQQPSQRGDHAMNEPHDPNRTVDVPSTPADALDAGLAAGFGRPADGPSSVLAGLRESLGDLRPVLLKEAQGESAHIVKPKSDAMPPPEQTGDRYQLTGEIARGGMGAVLRGHDVDLGRDLAVKVLLEKYTNRPEVARRFVEEAQIGGQLQHPGVVPVYDIGCFGDRPFFTMKLVKGHTLAALLSERADRAADRPRFLDIALKVAQTIAYAHAKGVIHRDLKPANIMVGSFGEVQVMDWGLAKVLAEGGVADEERASRAHQEPQDVTTIRTARSTGSASGVGTETEAGSLLGTPAYMAPEQANGDVVLLDRRCDVFGLGALLCEILTGKPPHVGRSYEEVRRKAANGDLADATARLDGCGADPELLALTRACLSPEAIDRPRDAQAVADGLTSYLDGVQERAHAAQRERAVAVARAVEERRRRKVQLALAASVLALLTLGGLGTAYYLQQQAERTQQQAEREQQRLEQAAAVDRVLGHVVTLRDEAVAHPDDVTRWQVARAAVEQAEVGDDAVARDRLLALRTEVEAGRDAAERDRALLDRLVDIRSARSDKTAEEREAAYAAAFRDAGIDLASLAPAEAGAKIKARPASVSLALAAVLDDWTTIRRGRDPVRAAQVSQPSRWKEAIDELARQFAAEAAQLRAVARIADPDPWRNELRAALDQADQATRLKALQALAKTAKFDELGPTSLHLLGSALNADGDSALAESVLRKAQVRYPRDLWVNYDLGNVLWRLERLDEAIRFYTAARAIRPECAGGLAVALERRGDLDEAIVVWCDMLALRPDYEHLFHLGGVMQGHDPSPEVAVALEPAVAAFREAARSKPDDVEAHLSLALALMLQGKLAEAIAEFRIVKALPWPKHDHFHHLKPNGFFDWGRGTVIGAGGKRDWDRFVVNYSTPDAMIIDLNYRLGNSLKDQGKLDEAITAYREAIRQVDEAPDSPFRAQLPLQYPYAESHCNLGATLKKKGDYAGALEMYRKGHALGSRRQGWPYPSAQWVAQAEREMALAPRLLAVLRGEDKPADNAERLYFANMAYDRRHFAGATRLWTEAFAADAGLANNLGTGFRYSAACSAALAAAGQGEDGAKLDDKERARLRQQALDWLRADLTLRSKQLEPGPTVDPAAVQQALAHWQQDPDLAGLRDVASLAMLPAEDRAACEKLWADVAGLVKQAKDQAQQLSQADALAMKGQSLLAEKKWAEAELPIRQCLPIREKMRPDAWNTFNAKAMLGGALLGQKKYAEAEPLLLAGYEGMKRREKSIPPQGKRCLPEAVERLVQLYEALDRKDEVARWTKEREALLAAAQPDDPAPLLTWVAMRESAALQAWFGQDKELAETCRRGLAMAKNTTVPETADVVAKACCLLPSTDKAHLTAALALARKAVQLGKDNPNLPWFQVALGMAEYRSGHFAEADAALLAAAKSAPNSPWVAGTSSLYRAMSLFRQGKEDAARKLAAEAAAAARMRPLPKDEKNPLAGNATPEDLILWLAYKEAKALIKFEAAPAPPGGK